MKQHVDFEEILKLPENKIETLLEYFPPLKMCNYKVNSSATIHLISSGLTIGKMLELITKNHTVKDMHEECIIPNESDYGFQWYISLFHDIDCPLIEENGEELCDVLWKLFKKVCLFMSDKEANHERSY